MKTDNNKPYSSPDLSRYMPKHEKEQISIKSLYFLSRYILTAVSTCRDCSCDQNFSIHMFLLFFTDIKLLNPLQGVIYKIIETSSAMFILLKNKDSRNHDCFCLSIAHDTLLYQ